MRDWTDISTGLYDQVVNSATTHEVPTAHWPGWTDTFGTEVEAIYAWRTPEDLTLAGTTVADGEGVFDLIAASDSSEHRWKAYRYVVKWADGRAQMSRPFKNMDYEHHTNFLPPWDISQRSTGA